MSNNKKTAKKGKVGKGIPKDDLHLISLILIIFGVIPHIVMVKIVELREIEQVSFNEKLQVDEFSYYKMVFLLLFTFLSFAVYIYKYIFKYNIIPFSEYKNIYYIFAIIYILFVILSTIASEYKSVAFFGYFDRYEGAFVLISYIIIMFLTMNVFTEDRSIKILFICLLISASIISIIGILQYFEIDIVSFIALKTVPQNVTIVFRQSLGPKSVYSTLYNPNYVGSYTAMLVPVSILLFIWVKSKTHRLIVTVSLCLIVLTWIICDSRAGIVGGLFAILIIAIMFRKEIYLHKILVLASIAVLLVGSLALNYITGGSVTNRLKRITSIGGKNSETENKKTIDILLEGLNDISMNEEKARIVTDKGTLQVVLLEGGVIKLIDENNQELRYYLEDNIVNFFDKRFQNIKLENISSEGKMIVYYNDYKLIDIIFTEDGLMSTYNRWMSYRNDKEIETFGFEGMESLGSNRGYIWSRTIPLLKNTIFLGYGPDTFPIYFPQYDFVGKLRNYETGDIFIDKPHNLYLQTAINTGIISLLAMLIMFGIYFVSSFKIYLKENFTSFRSIAGLACFTAFCAYTVAGLFNDSTVCVSPVFWALLGLGIGINSSLLKNKRDLDKNGGKGEKQSA